MVRKYGPEVGDEGKFKLKEGLQHTERIEVRDNKNKICSRIYEQQ